MTKSRIWTSEDEEVLRQLYLTKHPVERIAKRFETTKDAIKQKAHRMGLKRPKPEGAPKDDLATRLVRLQGLSPEAEEKPAFIGWFARHLRKHAKAVGHSGHVHPHLIRASAATALSESGVPTRDIMLQGGWDSESSLKHYLREKTEARRDRLREVLDL